MTFVPRQTDYESNPAYRLTDQDRIDLNLGYLGFPMREGDIRRKVEDVVARALDNHFDARRKALDLIREWAESDPNGDVRSSVILGILDSMNCPYDCGHRVCPDYEEAP